VRPEDKTEFAQTVAAAAAHKRMTLTPLDHRFWWEGMQDWTLPEFQAAMFRLIKTHDFMPTMKHFEDLRKAGRMTSGEAFAKALGWARDGSYKHPAKTPEAILIDRVVSALGGWSSIAGSDPDYVHFLEKRFAEHFETVVDVTDTREALPQIAGPTALHPRLAASMKQLTSVRPALELAKS
jgi:hypothetical protein